MIPLLRKDDLAMLSTESFLELLRLLPDDKRNKLLSNSKLKQYSVDGYRNLKYAPLKVLSAHAVKSHLFCETFLSLVVDEYNCLTPKDAQTFSIEEYPGILAYYLKCGLDVAPIEKRYNELIRETENETVLNPIEEQVKHNMIMKKYLGYAFAQKMLPKINGSGDDYGNSLKTLEQLFNANHFEKCATKVKEIYERGKISMNYYQYF